MTSRSKPTTPLVVTRDDQLREEILRLCAAAALSPDVLAEPDQVRRSWSTASCVLVGADCAGALADLALPRRPDVIVVSEPPESAELWRAAVGTRADHVVVLPDAGGWLVDRLSDSVDGALDAVTVGVIGASGGAGASTLAAALGLTAARRGNTALLVDVDRLGGGVELTVGCEAAPGLRWGDVAATRGRVSSPALRSALPSAEGLAVLSWGQDSDADLDPTAVVGVLTAGQRGTDVVIVDLPRHLDEAMRAAVQVVDTVLLVSTADIGSMAGARRLLRLLEAWCGDIRLAVRQRRGDGLAPESVASTLRLPVAAALPTRRSIFRSIDEGLGPLSRGGLEQRCSRLLDDLGVRPGVAA